MPLQKFGDAATGFSGRDSNGREAGRDTWTGPFVTDASFESHGAKTSTLFAIDAVSRWNIRMMFMAGPHSWISPENGAPLPNMIPDDTLPTITPFAVDLSYPNGIAQFNSNYYSNTSFFSCYTPSQLKIFLPQTIDPDYSMRISRIYLGQESLNWWVWRFSQESITGIHVNHSEQMSARSSWLLNLVTRPTKTDSRSENSAGEDALKKSSEVGSSPSAVGEPA